MCFYFTLEFRIYLELSSVSVGIKTCPYRICYECVQFQIEIRKISRSGLRSPPGVGEGVLPEKLSGGVRPTSPYPIYHQNLRYSLPFL